MVVQCPSCETRYRVSDEVQTTANPTFRCSRCGHVFYLESEAGSDEGPAAEDEEREPSFSFAPQKAKEMPRKEPGPLEFPDDSLPLRQEPTSLHPDDSFTIPEESAASEPQAEWEKAEPEQPSEARELDKPLSALSFLGFFVALLVFYSFVAATHRTKPEILDGWIRYVPWFGPAVFKNNHLRHGIDIQRLRTSFERVLENREIFVISGVVANRNRAKVRDVRIEGHIFNAEGKEIERQTISVGNAVSPKILRDLTVKEISILQKLSPQEHFGIAPDEVAPFTIVFAKPRGEIQSFALKVLAAEEA